MDSNTDVYSRLQREHKSIENLLNQLSSTTTVDTQVRQDCLKELKNQITHYHKAKNNVFYEALRQRTEAKIAIQESEMEHQRIETLLKELDHLSVGDPRWRAKLQNLKIMVEQHFNREEGPVFAKAKTILTETKARELGEQFDHAKAHASVSTTTGHATQYAPETAAKARDMGTRAQHEAERLSAEAKTKGRTLLHDQQRVIAEQIGGFAEALQQTAQHLQEQNRGVVAQYTEQAAQGLERFSRTLHERDVKAIVGQVEDFARRQPAVFMGSAALLGFLASRFLKSSAESRYPHSEPATDGDSTPYPQPPVGPGARVAPEVAPAGVRPAAPTTSVDYDR